MEPVVKVEVRNCIATVIMDRPPVNARNDRPRREPIAAFVSLPDDAAKARAACFEERKPDVQGR